MNTNDQIKLAHDTWQACLDLLPDLASNLSAKGPSLFKKENGSIDIARLCVLPTKKEPARFWSSKWCFYELGVGQYDGSPLILGGVSFLQFSDQGVCGKGHYFKAVHEILNEVQRLRPQDFELGLQSNKGARVPVMARRYKASKSQPTFHVQTAAADLAWLIRNTLPQFQSLPSV